MYVEDNFPTDEIGKKLLKECDKELKDSFNINDQKDLGEYKTLLYAKLCILSFSNCINPGKCSLLRFINTLKHSKGCSSLVKVL